MANGSDPENGVQFPLTSGMKFSEGVREILQGGIQLPGEGISQQRDVICNTGDYDQLITLLEKFADVTPRSTNNQNGQDQVAAAADAIDSLAAEAEPIPLPSGSAPYPDASYPPPTTSILNVTVENIPNDDGSVDIVIRKITTAKVENYPEGMTFDSLYAYNSYQKANEPVISADWALLFPDPKSTDVISLPEFTLNDTPGGIRITADYSAMTGKGSTTEVAPPKEVSEVYGEMGEPVESDDDGDDTDSDPDANPFSSDDSGSDPFSDDDGGGGDNPYEPPPAPDPDQPQPDPVDPDDDD